MNWAHVHLLSNHIPVIGTAVGVALLGYGLWRKDQGVMKAALGVFVVVAAVAVTVFLTGEPAEDLLERTVRVPEALLDEHEDAALPALVAMGLVGAVSLIALIVARGKVLTAAWTRATLVLAVVAFGLVARTAALGGQIRHEEIRAGAAPTAGHAEEHEDR